nr:hypothetical protein [Rhodococcus sp. 06-1059B-a]
MSTHSRLERALKQITRATARLDSATRSGITVDVTGTCIAVSE